MKKLTIIVSVAVLLAGITGCELLDRIKQKGHAHAVKTETGSTSSVNVHPFPVNLCGQAAVKRIDICAAIANPVANNAEIVVDAPTDEMIIINAFPSDANGKIPSGVKTAIILIKKGKNKSTIDKTTDNKKLKAGTYLMNVVAGGKTARVVFVVK